MGGQAEGQINQERRFLMISYEFKERVMAKLHANFEESDVLIEKYEGASDLERRRLTPLMAVLNNERHDLCVALIGKEK